MNRLRFLLLEHKWAIGLAILSSIIACAPQIAFRVEHKDDGIYQGIEMLPDSPWSARIREVQDGHPSFGAIYYKDGKDDPYVFQPLGSFIIGTAGKALSLDINNTILFSRAVVPFAAFLAIYGFVFVFSRRKLVSLVAAAVWMLGESALSSFGIQQLLQGVAPEDFLRISRPLSPVIVYLFTFGFLAAFWKFYEKLDWRWGALVTVLLGANFYNYFYAWTFLYAVGGILGLMLLILKEWARAFKVAVVYAAGLVLGIPSFLNLYAATQHPNYLETSMRTGILQSHEPLFIGFLSLAAILAFVLLYPRNDKQRFFFGLALVLSPLVTLNQQLITGKVLQEAHYHWFFHKPVAVIVALVIVFVLLHKYGFGRYEKWLAGALIVGSVAVSAFVQWSSYTHPFKEGGAIAVERQKYGPVVRWLNEHAQKEEVVFATDLPSHIVTIYTPLNVFYHRAGMYSLSATRERLEAPLFALYRLRGVGGVEAEDVFFKERGYLSANLYGMHYRELLGTYEQIPDDKVAEIVSEYKKILETPLESWLEETFKKYEVSYIIWDKKADPAWNLDRYSFVAKAAEFGDIAIYRTTYGN